MEYDPSMFQHGVKPSSQFDNPTDPLNYALARLNEERDVTLRLTPHIDTLNDVILRLIKDRSQSISSAVVELGTGTGATTASILQRSPDTQLVCVDFNTSRLERAAVRLASHLGQITFEVSDAVNYLRTIKDDSVACIVTASMLHNLPLQYRRIILSEVHRVLSPGGMFVDADKHGYRDPHIDEELFRQQIALIAQNFMDKPEYSRDWVAHFTEDYDKDEKREDYLGYLEDMGFEAQSVFGFGLDIVVSAQKIKTK